MKELNFSKNTILFLKKEELQFNLSIYFSNLAAKLVVPASSLRTPCEAITGPSPILLQINLG